MVILYLQNLNLQSKISIYLSDNGSRVKSTVFHLKYSEYNVAENLNTQVKYKYLILNRST